MKVAGFWLGLLLRAFPPEFRRSHAEDLGEYVAAERCHPRFATPGIGAARFWSWVSFDLVRGGIRLRRRAGRQHPYRNLLRLPA